jgi:membrane associated rhomboid family serine protease
MLVPIGDNSALDRRPLATWGLIAANAAIFLLVSDEAAMRWGLVPAACAPATFFTSMFLHAGVLHLVGNMIFLAVAGPPVESKLGRAGFLGFYLGAGLFGGLVHVVANTGSPLPAVGASGAISGVIAAYAVLCTYRQVRFFYFMWYRAGTFEIAAGWAVGLWFAMQVLESALSRKLGVSGGIAYGAHLGGALAGAGAALLLARAGLVERDRDPDLVAAERFRAETAAREVVQQTLPPLTADLAGAIGRVLRAGPLLRGRGPAMRFDIVLVMGDERAAGRAAALATLAPGETRLDVTVRIARTGIVTRGLGAAEATRDVLAMRRAGIGVVALSPRVAPLAFTTLRGARATAAGIEGVVGLDARPVRIGWGEIEAAEAVEEPFGARAIDVLAGARRFSLKHGPARLLDLARAIAERAPSPIGVGRSLRALAAGGTPRRIPAAESAEILGCLAALADADRAARAIPATA